MFGKKLTDKVNQINNKINNKFDGKVADLYGALSLHQVELEVLRNRDREQEREIAQLKHHIDELSKRIPVIKFLPGNPTIVEVEEPSSD